jgi:hypothetical protein
VSGSDDHEIGEGGFAGEVDGDDVFGLAVVERGDDACEQLPGCRKGGILLVVYGPGLPRLTRRRRHWFHMGAPAVLGKRFDPCFIRRKAVPDAACRRPCRNTHAGPGWRHRLAASLSRRRPKRMACAAAQTLAR